MGSGMFEFRKTAIVLGLAVGILTPCGQAAIAQGVADPISINTCAAQLRPNPAPSSVPTFMGIPIGPVTSTSSGMHIVFVNDSQKVAKLVNFAVDANGNQFVVRDVGVFSPGVEIDHQYSNGAGMDFVLPTFIAPNVKCRVASVEFNDGTMWRPGQPPNTIPHALASPGQAGLSIAPAQLTLNSRSESALFMAQAPTRLADLKETDNCTGIASVLVGAVADRAASYYVRPLAPGSCAAHVIDEDGNTASIPIIVH
jgi:hypothetical protein